MYFISNNSNKFFIILINIFNIFKLKLIYNSAFIVFDSDHSSFYVLTDYDVPACACYDSIVTL